MAALTFQNIIDTARITLNDADKDRYLDADGLTFAGDCLRELSILRPDLFIGQFGTYDGSNAYVLADPLPIDNRYARIMSDYIIFRLTMVDAEYVQSGYSEVHKKFFEERLM